MDGSINFSGTLAGSIADSGGGRIQDVETNASGDYETVVDENGIAKIDLSNYATDEQLESAVNSINSVLLTKLNKVNFSTDEQNTGLKWIDGKDLYMQVIQANNLNTDTVSNALISNVDYFTCLGITVRIHGGSKSYSPSQISMYNYQGVGTSYGVLYYDSSTHELKISNNSRTNAIDATAIVLFTKI